MNAAKHCYVNIPGKEPAYSTIGQALNAVTCSTTAPKAYPAPDEDFPPTIIHIGPGIYREKLTVTQPYLTLEGAGSEDTILVYGDYANAKMEDGSKRGTFRTAALRIDTHDFTARKLTIQNDAGYGHTVGQALALYADGDRILLEDCRILGSQDTVFAAPLPLKEAKPGGFIGPGEHTPRIMGRHCYRNCYICGDVDFIFGGARAYFTDCTIFSQKPGNKKPPESPEEQMILGYVTAASTPQEQSYGFVFKHCRLTSDCPPGSVYLGRPWREYAKTVFLDCELGEHIHPAGWSDWNKPHDHFYYGEYHSRGPGASPAGRADFSHQLTDQEAAKYTIENVLDGWLPF